MIFFCLKSSIDLQISFCRLETFIRRKKKLKTKLHKKAENRKSLFAKNLRGENSHNWKKNSHFGKEKHQTKKYRLKHLHVRIGNTLAKFSTSFCTLNIKSEKKKINMNSSHNMPTMTPANLHLKFVEKSMSSTPIERTTLYEFLSRSFFMNYDLIQFAFIPSNQTIFFSDSSAFG